MTKKRNDKILFPTLDNQPVDVAEKSADFDLPIAKPEEAKSLRLTVEVATAIEKAVSELLSRLPDLQTQPGFSHAQCCRPSFKPHNPQTLPALTTQLPVLPGYEQVHWRQIEQLPGYRLRPIRNLGNDVFMAFPCFGAFVEEAKARKLDAHGKILTISDFIHDRQTINDMAKLIVDNGVLLDIARLDYGNTAPNYHPRVALFMTETWTFQLVQDKVQNGAPVNANFIYAWPGGKKFYMTYLASHPSAPVLDPMPLPLSALPHPNR